MKSLNQWKLVQLPGSFLYHVETCFIKRPYFWQQLLENVHNEGRIKLRLSQFKIFSRQRIDAQLYSDILRVTRRHGAFPVVKLNPRWRIQVS